MDKVEKIEMKLAEYVGGKFSSKELNIAMYFYKLGLKEQLKEKNEGMTEALRTEYEKGRADVIADTLSWLDNCWPQYCDNPNIIKGFKEAIKGE